MTSCRALNKWTIFVCYWMLIVVEKNEDEHSRISLPLLSTKDDDAIMDSFDIY